MLVKMLVQKIAAVHEVMLSRGFAAAASPAWAIMCPGQGAQKPGMGKDLAEHFACAREVFQEVDDVLKEMISKKMFTGTQEELSMTEVTQPALLAHSVAAYRVMERECGVSASSAAAVMGHSVGEYAALVAAGSISLADAAVLLKKRAIAMQAAADAEAKRLGSSEPAMCMTALLVAVKPPPTPTVPPGKETFTAVMYAHTRANQACHDAKLVLGKGWVTSSAAVNSPSQVVLSGHTAAVAKAVEILKARGENISVKRTISLPVSAPFHCDIMEPAAQAVRAVLTEKRGATDTHVIDVRPPTAPLVCNSMAVAVTTPAVIRAALVDGIVGTVRWAECVETATGLSPGRAMPRPANAWIEVGTGNTLAGLVKQILPKEGSGLPGAPVYVGSVGIVEDIKTLKAFTDQHGAV